MKFKITISDLRKLKPCQDPNNFGIPNGWRGTLLDILKMKQIQPVDKIWAVTKLLDEKTARLFAVDCARQALVNVKDDKIKSVLINTLDVATRYANGKASKEELSAARSAAWSAAWSAVAAADAAAVAAAAAESAARSASAAAAWSAQVTTRLGQVAKLRAMIKSKKVKKKSKTKVKK